jgi:exonuclease I
MPAIHFYDAITAGKNAAEGQLVRYHSIFVSGDAAPEILMSAIKLRDDVYVDPIAAAKGELALLDLMLGESELEWARTAFKHFMTKDCLHVGFGNSTRLDPYIRYGLYRNLLPYPCIGLPKGSHFLDVETLLRAVAVLRPEDFPWPESVRTLPMPAMHHFLMWEADVNGTNRAILVKEILEDLAAASPKLIEHAIRTSSIDSIKSCLGLDGGEVSDLRSVKPCLMVHPLIPHTKGAILALPVAVDITYPDIVYVADLESDLSALCDPDVESLQALVRVNPTDLHKPLIRVSLSRAPFCAAIGVVRPKDACRLAIDIRTVLANVEYLRAADHLAARLKDEPILELAAQPADVDHRMWAGDFNGADVLRMQRLHEQPIDQWPSIVASGNEGRFRELGRRLIGRTKPELLDAGEREALARHFQNKAAGNFQTPERLAHLRKQGQDIAMESPKALGLVQLNERLARILG